MAVATGKSLFLHCRELDADRGEPIGAHQDLLSVLAGAGVSPSQCCVHCFTGNESELRELLVAGFNVGITGFVCKGERGQALRAALSSLAAELGAEAVARQLNLETDAPFMRPPDALLRASAATAAVGDADTATEGASVSDVASDATSAVAPPPRGQTKKGKPAKAGTLVLARGKESEPAMTVAVCRTVAECLSLPAETVAAATTARARALFFGPA